MDTTTCAATMEDAQLEERAGGYVFVCGLCGWVTHRQHDEARAAVDFQKSHVERVWLT